MNMERKRRRTLHKAMQLLGEKHQMQTDEMVSTCVTMIAQALLPLKDKPEVVAKIVNEVVPSEIHENMRLMMGYENEK